MRRGWPPQVGGHLGRPEERPKECPQEHCPEERRSEERRPEERPEERPQECPQEHRPEERRPMCPGHQAMGAGARTSSRSGAQCSDAPMRPDADRGPAVLFGLADRAALRCRCAATLMDAERC